MEFFSRLPRSQWGKNELYRYSCIIQCFLRCKILWTQESLIPFGQTALRGGAFGRVSDLVWAILDEMLLGTSAEIKSVVLPILTAPATYSEA